MTESNTHQSVASSIIRGSFRVFVTITSFLGVMGILVVALLGFALAGGPQPLMPQSLSQKLLREGDPSATIAVVSLNGPIVDQSTAESFGVNSEIVSAVDINRTLETLAQDDQVKAVLVRINSPGGTVVGSDEIYHGMQKLRSKKPVIASLSDTAASGGYYIAAGATKIIANSATVTGSIGVIAQFPQVSGLMEKLGVELRTVKSGQFKDIGSPTRDLTATEQTILDSIITDSYDQFIEAIVTGRGMDEAKVRELADGRIFTGKQALENGLVDQLGTFDDAIELAEKEAQVTGTQVVEYSHHSFWESLLSVKTATITPLASIEKLLSVHQFGVYYILSL